jgi:flagellar basal-body rod modification protein FlgD
MTTIAAAASAASQQTPATGTGTTGIAGDFNTFLTLLTTQLKNQDPTNALDTSQMTQQLVAFAQVEQQISMNSNLGKLITLQQTQELTQAGALIGRRVEVQSDRLSLQSGQATVRLPPAGNATQAVVNVQNAAGQVIRSATLPLGQASTDWVWDGKGSGGQRLPDGAYTYAVGGVAPGGSAVPLTATVVATATATERRNGELSLVLGGLSLGFDKVVKLDGN